MSEPGTPARWLNFRTSLLNSDGALMLFAALFALLSTWIGMQITGFPQPIIHDEHSYLLAADTFVSGRLANPSHPMGWFFETYHQLQTPAYVSKYPPAQGLFLAAGQILGEPLYGVWLAHALFAAASFWMARAFMPRYWSLAAAVVASIWFGFLCYWTTSYWGGTVAALGGVLVWGGAKRLHVHFATIPALFLGIGAGLLMLSRPFEGLLACIIPGLLLLLCLVRSRARGRLLRDSLTLFWILAPVFAAAALQLAINRAVTGDVLTAPYQEYNRQYDSTPIFFWQRAGAPPEFHHERMELFDRAVAEPATRFPTPFLPFITARVWDFISFFSGGVLLLAIIFYCIRPSRWAGWMLASLCVSLSSLVLVHYYSHHYLAPAVAPVIVLVAWVLRNARHLLPQQRQIGSWAVLPMALFLIILVHRGSGIRLQPTIARHGLHRESIMEKLGKETSSRHLILVEYEPGVNPHVEYVFNTANIDKQPIVWARWSKDAAARGLFNYYRDRKFWLLRVRREGEPVLREFVWVPNSK